MDPADASDGSSDAGFNVFKARSRKRVVSSEESSPGLPGVRPNVTLADVLEDPSSGPRRESSPPRKPNATKKRAASSVTTREKQKGSKRKDTRRSQVVDLTISSDAAQPDQNDEGDQGSVNGSVKGLPNGPGWVQKSFGKRNEKERLRRRTRSSV